MYHHNPHQFQTSTPIPPSPAAGSMEARQMAIATWRRQQEDALRQMQATNAQQRGYPVAYPSMRNPVHQENMHGTSNVGMQKNMPSAEEFEKVKRHVAEMRRYFKYWVRREGRLRTNSAVAIQSAVRSYQARQCLLENSKFWKYINLHRRLYHGKQLSSMYEQYPTLDSLLLPPSWVYYNGRRAQTRKARLRKQKRRLEQGGSTAGSGDGTFAATIQSRFRGYRIRKILALIQAQKRSATRIQSTWRGCRVRKKASFSQGMTTGKSIITAQSEVIASLYAMINTLKHENKLQKQRGDAQEKALRLLWNEVRELKQQITTPKN